MTAPDERVVGRFTSLSSGEHVAAWLREALPRTDDTWLSVHKASGHRLAAPVVTPVACPGAAQALYDGYAVAAGDTDGASVYNPMCLIPGRSAIVVRRGADMPPGSDAVLLPSAVSVEADALQVHASVAAGEGVIPAGGVSSRGDVLLPRGTLLSRTDVAVLANLGVRKLRVLQVPGALVVRCRSTPSGSIAADRVLDLCGRLGIPACGADADSPAALERCMEEHPDRWLVAVGAAGVGADDFIASWLHHHGRLDVHGLAWRPGRAVVGGSVDGRPVLGISGNPVPCHVLCEWLLAPALRQWLGAGTQEAGEQAVLLGKIASPLGVEEYRPVRQESGGIRPLPMVGEGDPSLLLRADGWVRVPAHSEGYAAGESVPVLRAGRR